MASIQYVYDSLGWALFTAKQGAARDEIQQFNH
jgi:hypothetical protein